MSDLDVSSSTRALLDAAKKDGPSQLAKAKIWGGVAATTAAAAGAGASAGGVSALGALGSGKLIVAGALFGSAVTVGLAMALMHVGPLAPSTNGPRADTQTAAPAPVRDPVLPALPTRAGSAVDPAAPAAAPLAGADAPAPLANSATDPATQAAGTTPTGTPTAATTAAAKPRGDGARNRAARASADKNDLLDRESYLVAEARGALVRGDARASLAAVRAAQALDSHALDPEELSLEARALRALGNGDDADRVDAKLRSRYPDHALAR